MILFEFLQPFKTQRPFYRLKPSTASSGYDSDPEGPLSLKSSKCIRDFIKHTFLNFYVYFCFENSREIIAGTAGTAVLLYCCNFCTAGTGGTAGGTAGTAGTAFCHEKKWPLLLILEHC